MAQGADRFRQSLGDIETQPGVRRIGTVKLSSNINADYDVVAEAEAILAEAALVSA